MSIIKRVALTVFLLSLLEPFLFGGGRWMLICLSGGGWLLFWELIKRLWRHREWRLPAFLSLSVIGLILVVFVMFVGAQHREWLVGSLQDNWRRCVVLLFVGVLTLVLSVLEDRLILLSPFCLLGVVVIALWELPIHRVGMIGALYFCVLSIIEYVGISSYGKEIRNRLNGFFWIPLCLCICLAVLPVSDKPYPYTGLKHLWAQVREGFSVLYTELSLMISHKSSDFYVQFTGYSEEGAVGGSLLGTDKPAMLLTVSGSLKGNLYLAGNIQNQYEKNRWSFESGMALEEELTLDTLELLYAVWQETAESEREVSAYLSNTSASVIYQGLYTKDLFFPAKFCGFRQLEEYKSQGSKFVSSRARKEGDSYGFRYLTLNYGSDEFESLVQSRREVVYQTEEMENKEFAIWISQQYPQLRRAVPDMGLEMALAKRREQIYRDYMQIPDYLYKEIQTLAVRLTEGEETELEKLHAIERYLQGFSYTSTPGEPEGDAVYEFLFHTGEGYCTYFASAFVLLSRAAGIPARYVNGFCIPIYTEGKREYLVESSCAHAWPEAYLNGIGWLSFEPTSGYEGYHNTPWKLESSVWQEPSQTQIESVTQREEMGEEWEEEEILLPSQTSSTEVFSVVRWLIVLCLILLLSVFLICFFVRLWRRKRRYQRSSVEGKLTMLMCYEMALLRAAGIGRQKEETLLAYGQRVLVDCPALMETGFSEFLGLYMDSFYGRVPLLLEAEVLARDCVRETEKIVLCHDGENIQRWRMFYILYLRFTFSENMI